MTLRRIEGWDWQNTGAQSTIFQAMDWSGDVGNLSVQTSSPVASRFGYGNYLRIGPTNFTSLASWAAPKMDLGTSGGMSYIGMAIWRQDNATNGQGWSIRFVEAISGVTHLTVALQDYGVIKVYRGTSGGTLLTSVGPAVYDYNNWFYLEVGFNILDVGGSIEVRMNGVTVIDLVDIDTANGTSAYWNVIAFAWSSLSQYLCIDDFYICDDQGAENNNFLGNARVKALLANGAGDLTQFTRSNTSLLNWQNAINKSVDDTLYVYTPTVGDQDLYTVTPIINAPVIFGIDVLGFYRQDDATQLYPKNTIKSGGVTSYGAVNASYSTYKAFRDIWELDPATSVGFTGTAVNALQIGPNLDHSD